MLCNQVTITYYLNWYRFYLCSMRLNCNFLCLVPYNFGRLLTFSSSNELVPIKSMSHITLLKINKVAEKLICVKTEKIDWVFGDTTQCFLYLNYIYNVVDSVIKINSQMSIVNSGIFLLHSSLKFNNLGKNRQLVNLYCIL